MEDIYFLENFIDFDINSQNFLKVTYLKKDCPPLEQILLNKDVVLKGSEIHSIEYSNDWYLFKGCYFLERLEHQTYFDTFVIISIKFQYKNSVSDKNEIRKFVIRDLFIEEQIQIEDKLSGSQIQIEGLNLDIDTLSLGSKIL